MEITIPYLRRFRLEALVSLFHAAQADGIITTPDEHMEHEQQEEELATLVAQEKYDDLEHDAQREWELIEGTEQQREIEADDNYRS